MVRNYQKKSNGRESKRVSAKVMRTATKMVLIEGMSVNRVSADLEIPRTTLTRYVEEARLKGLDSVVDFQKSKAHRSVFTKDQELKLKDYILTASRQHHGLTKKQVRQLAWEYAKRNNCVYPSGWDDNECAGGDWISGFLKRHQSLSCRKPEATSLGRSTSFNKVNVGKFHDNLDEVLSRYNFCSRDIWNMDETGLTTAHKPPKVIADKKAKQVGQVTSAERGVLTTAVCAINAAGGFIPPMMIFPRVNFKEYMVAGAPSETLGAANPSGWISSELFIKWLNHFIKHTRVTKERPVLLLMDNHESHISIQAIELAKENGVVLLTFPPHCSHKLQPLDISVYGPLKRFFNDASNSWQLNNPGKTLTIYNMAELFNASFGRAMTVNNITSGFRKPGISPFDRHAFSDDDFLGSYVTDRATPTLDDNTPGCSHTSSTTAAVTFGCSDATSTTEDATLTVSKTLPMVSPEEIRPFPKAGQRKANRLNKRKFSSILTNTPVKEKLADEAEKRAKKKSRKIKVFKKKAARKQLIESSDEEQLDAEEKELAKQLQSDSSDELTSEADEITQQNIKIDNLNISEYVLVAVHGKRATKHFVAVITSIIKPDDEVCVDFLTNIGNQFAFPDEKDSAIVPMKDIVLLLPSPAINGGTKRTSQKLHFAVDLHAYM